MTDAQLKEITDRLDAIKHLLEETIKAMSANAVSVQNSISTATDSIAAMQLMFMPAEADDVGRAIADALKTDARDR